MVTVNNTLGKVRCDRCGTTFRMDKFTPDEREWHWCSKDCRLKFKRKRRRRNPIGEVVRLHISPAGEGTIGYGNNWATAREAALSRDDRRCQECGITESQHVEEYGSGLHVHHQTPLRRFNTPEEANQLENLVSLCCECHGKMEMKA